MDDLCFKMACSNHFSSDAHGLIKTFFVEPALLRCDIGIHFLSPAKGGGILFLRCPSVTLVHPEPFLCNYCMESHET